MKTSNGIIVIIADKKQAHTDFPWNILLFMILYMGFSILTKVFIYDQRIVYKARSQYPGIHSGKKDQSVQLFYDFNFTVNHWVLSLKSWKSKCFTIVCKRYRIDESAERLL